MDNVRLPRRSGLVLFDAFASTEKTLHANVGTHKELPRFEADSAVRFFVRHVSRALASADCGSPYGADSTGTA